MPMAGVYLRVALTRRRTGLQVHAERTSRWMGMAVHATIGYRRPYQRGMPDAKTRWG